MENNYNYNAPAAPVAPQQAPANNKNKLIIIAGVAVVAIIAIIAIIAGVAGSGYKKPIKNMAQAIEEADADMFFESFAEEKLDQLDGGGDMKDFYFKVLFDYIEDECGEGYKVKVEYGDKSKASKDEIEDFVDEAEDEEGLEYDADDMKNLYEVEVTMAAEGDDGEVDIFDGEVFVAKYDGEWIIVNMDLDVECEDDLDQFIEENIEDYYEELMSFAY